MPKDIAHSWHTAQIYLQQNNDTRMLERAAQQPYLTGTLESSCCNNPPSPFASASQAQTPGHTLPRGSYSNAHMQNNNSSAYTANGAWTPPTPSQSLPSTFPPGATSKWRPLPPLDSDEYGDDSDAEDVSESSFSNTSSIYEAQPVEDDMTGDAAWKLSKTTIDPEDEGQGAPDPENDDEDDDHMYDGWIFPEPYTGQNDKEMAEWVQRFLAAAVPRLAICKNPERRMKKIDLNIMDTCDVGDLAEAVHLAYLYQHRDDIPDNDGYSDSIRESDAVWMHHWRKKQGGPTSPPRQFRMFLRWKWPEKTEAGVAAASWPVVEGPRGEIIRQDVVPPPGEVWSRTSKFHEMLEEDAIETESSPKTSGYQKLKERFRTLSAGRSLGSSGL